IIGTAAADSGGNWSFNYTGTSLPEGVTSFTGYSTLNSVVGPSSGPFKVTVDLTAPTVTVSVPATTKTVKPVVKATAPHTNGLPSGTTVTFDVDPNNNGVWTDPGDFSTTGTLTNGTAAITLSTALAVSSTAGIRARVTDVAGNQGTSATSTVQVLANTG